MVMMWFLCTNENTYMPCRGVPFRACLYTDVVKSELVYVCGCPLPHMRSLLWACDDDGDGVQICGATIRMDAHPTYQLTKWEPHAQLVLSFSPSTLSRVGM